MAFGEIGKIVKNVGSGIFNRTLGRLLGAGISTDSRLVNARAKWSGRGDKTDWRVRLQIPAGASALQKAILGDGTKDNNELLAPLRKNDLNGIFWPLTPAVVIQHSANYNPLAQTHSNYPFQAYQNSQVDSLNIIGEFPVQNSDDAKHWVATVNFLRTVTKMFFGKEQDLKGNPPPILHMSGYGDHMFNKVPVIINTFNVELRPGIDYISTKQNPDGYSTARTRERMGLPELDDSQTWAPTLSNISVLVTPVYSRDSIKNFSLSEFARGELNGKGAGEIGFI
jgi:hypothetical protein|tara:strand:+ start:116 stop:961 length:846 start_codon:yes stop_codon:yes gene_type:complete